MTTKEEDLATESNADSGNGLGRNYDRAAWFYEKGAKLYSTNQIRASKRFQIKFIQPGDKVLYLGVGTGEDAVMAARIGASVTCIDISKEMLERVRTRCEKEDLKVELICGDAFQHDRKNHYDVCIANYFLNVFRLDPMQKMLAHTASLVRSGGKYLIADVSLPQGSFPARVFNTVYLKMAMASFWIIGLVPWHENYDYVKSLQEIGWEPEHVEYFRFAKRGPVLFQSIVASRPG